MTSIWTRVRKPSEMIGFPAGGFFSYTCTAHAEQVGKKNCKQSKKKSKNNFFPGLIPDKMAYSFRASLDCVKNVFF